MLYHFTERHNRSLSHLTEDFQARSPVVPHSASKYIQKARNVRGQKLKVLKNSLKIQKQLTGQLNVRLNYKLGKARRSDDMSEMAEIDCMLEPVAKLPSMLSRSTTASSMTELCSQEFLESAMQSLQTELGIFDKVQPKILPAEMRVDHSDIMLQRYQKTLQNVMPAFENLLPSDREQSAPEYAQVIYDDAKRSETVVGNYFTGEDALSTSPEHRREMVNLIELLCHRKNYHDETSFLAVNIADRFLSAVAKRSAQTPSHVLLALTVTVLAAKITESSLPCYDYTVSMLPEFLRQKVNKDQFKILEGNILTLLEFSLHYNCPMFYLSRYLRIFGLDAEEYEAIRAWAVGLCQLLQRETIYLELRPSQVAAASLMFAANMADRSAQI